jgi:hypothetical protein
MVACGSSVHRLLDVIPEGLILRQFASALAKAARAATTSNADRARRAAAGQGIFHPGISRTAKAMSGGNQQRGGGASYKRGAYTRAQAIEIEAGKLRAAAAAAAAKPRGQ